jgi:hypothetical protein
MNDLNADRRLDLPDVTLAAASSIALPATVRAMRLCMKQVRFRDVKLFTDSIPQGLDLEGIRWVRIEHISSRPNYSRFVLKELHRHIDTPFLLLAQWDGYILDAARWRDEFLSYDYIGAPWPQFHDGMTVGNGGFSLRSLKLLRACSDDRLSSDQAEDVTICRTHRPLLEAEHGIRFAPDAVARHFAYERTERSGEEFGFHGSFNMPGLMAGKDFRHILATSEPHLLGKRERRDIFRAAVRRLDIRLIIRIALLTIMRRAARRRG